jgi:hypothetical protein
VVVLVVQPGIQSSKLDIKLSGIRNSLYCSQTDSHCSNESNPLVSLDNLSSQVPVTIPTGEHPSKQLYQVFSCVIQTQTGWGVVVVLVVVGGGVVVVGGRVVVVGGRVVVVGGEVVVGGGVVVVVVVVVQLSSQID